MNRLEGKVAIITGSASGQGAAEARLFAAEGAKVVVSDVNVELGEKVAAEIGDSAIFQKLDVRSPEDWDAAVQRANETFGEVTVLVNNAAINSTTTPNAQEFKDVTLESFRTVLDINLVGQFIGIQAVLPSMLRAGIGSIINVSSTGGFFVRWGAPGYSTSKWGIRGLTKAAAVDLGKFNIRVNSLHPGGVDTPMRSGTGRSEEFLQSLNERRAVGRVGQPEEIAWLAVFLASDESSYSTGAEFIADGGALAGDPRRF